MASIPKTDVSRGARYGRLTVLRPDGRAKGRRRWYCVCDCGRVKRVTTRLLRGEKTRSCGCLRIESGRRAAGRLNRGRVDR